MNTSHLIPQIVIKPETSEVDNNLLLELLRQHKIYLQSILLAQPYDISVQNIQFIEQKIARLTIKITSLTHQLNKNKNEKATEE